MRTNKVLDMPLNLLDDSWYSLFLFIYYMHFNDTYATKRVTKPVGEGFDEVRELIGNTEQLSSHPSSRQRSPRDRAAQSQTVKF
jgi:hypothetical protein